MLFEIRRQITEAIILTNTTTTTGEALESVSMKMVNGKPLLSYIIKRLKSVGIEKVVISLNKRDENIQSYFRNFYRGVYVEYFIEQEGIGSGGAVYKSLQMINKMHCFVINGNRYCEANFDLLEKIHLDNNSNLTICLHSKADSDGVNIDFDNQNKIIDTKKDSSYSNTGIYVLNKFYIAKLALPSKFSFKEKVAYARMKKDNFYVCTHDDELYLNLKKEEDRDRAQTLLNDTEK